MIDRGRSVPDNVRVGCQTFTWEMLGDRYQEGPDRLLEMIAEAGYAGIEITDTMIGDYAGRPGAFAEALRTQGLALVAFAIGSKSGFTEPALLASDLDAVDRAIAFAGAFPGALVSIGSATKMSPGTAAEKFQAAAKYYNAAGERGRQARVAVALHPSSHHNTLLASRDDYDRIFALTDPALIGWVPDTGHMLRGHPDMLDTLCHHRDRIRYLHLKDVDADGNWAMLGHGACDVGAVIDIVRGAPAFNGWLVLEEESAPAAADPQAAVRANRMQMRRYGF
jgi:inosose dehydratase